MVSTTLTTFQQSLTTFCANNNLTTLPQHAHQVLTCFIVYEGLFRIVSPLLSKRLFPNTYGRFPQRTKVNWDARVVSTVQATFVSYKALSIILGDGVGNGNRQSEVSKVPRSSMTRDDRLWGYSPATGDVQAYAAGYFLWDVLLCVRYLDVQGVSALLHALSALIITVMGFVSPPSILFPPSTNPLHHLLSLTKRPPTAPIRQLLRAQLHPLRTVHLVPQYPLVPRQSQPDRLDAPTRQRTLSDLRLFRLPSRLGKLPDRATVAGRVVGLEDVDERRVHTVRSAIRHSNPRLAALLDGFPALVDRRVFRGEHGLECAQRLLVRIDAQGIEEALYARGCRCQGATVGKGQRGREEVCRLD